jgi:hypothetical protein
LLKTQKYVQCWWSTGTLEKYWKPCISTVTNYCLKHNNKKWLGQ